MEKLTIYYSVVNGGDGSVYPKFFTDKGVAEYYQETQEEESWGEPCTGSITFEGDNLCCPEVTTKEGYYLELLLDGWENEDEVQAFVAQFLPNGVPVFEVKILDDAKRHGVFFESKLLYYTYEHEGEPTEKGGDVIKAHK